MSLAHTHVRDAGDSKFAVADKGASGHYLHPNAPCLNKTPDLCPVRVRLPNGHHIHSSHKCELNVPSLPINARIAHILPKLANDSLVSIGKMCSAGCVATFTSTTVTITYNDITVLEGIRDHTTGLWKVPLVPASTSLVRQHAINTAYQLPRNVAQSIQHLYRAAFSPVKSTLIQAIKKGVFLSWPGFSVARVQRHLDTSVASVKGHLDQTRANQLSTKVSSSTITSQVITGDIITSIQPTYKIYSDQTGRFPVTSSRGHQYIMIMYVYDLNAILEETVKSRTSEAITATYIKMFQYLKHQGYTPKAHWLDNEAPEGIKAFDALNNVHFQLVPPHIHRRNAAERAIHTFKNHFIAGLCSVHSSFPLHLWDRLIPQAVMTLNMLRASRLHPEISAYMELEGAFDYNATPLAPPGSKVVVHEKSQVRRTWAPHGVDGWYVGPAMQHYRCFKVYIAKTCTERISDTVHFFDEEHNMDIRSARKIATGLLQAHLPHDFTQIGNNTMHLLKMLAKSLGIKKFHDKTTDNNLPAPRVVESTPILPRVPVASDNEPSPVGHHRYPLRSRGSIPELRLNAVIDQQSGKKLEYKQLIANQDTKDVWTTSFARELGRLAQGFTGHVSGTDTLFPYLLKQYL